MCHEPLLLPDPLPPPPDPLPLPEPPPGPASVWTLYRWSLTWPLSL